MELLRRVHQLQGESIFVPAQAADLSPIVCLDYDKIALAALALVWVENRLTQNLRVPAADRRKVRPQPASATVYLMTGRARAFAEEDSSSSGRVSGDILWPNSSAETADVAHQLPDFGRQHVECRHLAARNAFSYILKDLCVLAAVKKFPGRQRWSAPAARVTTMTYLACFLK
jgi:hypothetical protein